MTAMIIWRMLLSACNYIPALWLTVVVVRFFARTYGATAPTWTSWVRFELDYLIPPMMVLAVIFDEDTGRVHTSWYTPLSLAWNLAMWWWIRADDKDDDDRWRKRRKRLTARVAAVAGRLVVQPT